VKRAQQKQSVQQTVYSGEAFKADVFKPHEVMDLLFDDEDDELKQNSKFMKTGDLGRRKSRIH
jgi:DNA helicase INO80